MNSNRIIGLDIIRGVAILLVLFRHGDYICYLQEIGWMGVDLFFVLSGFLVSGLLFKEFKRIGSLNIKRFIVRRSLKIFPSFYFFTAVFIALSYFVWNTSLDTDSILHELLYVQNYFKGINGHTWSLAVEEQFYIGFAILMFVAYKLNWINKKAAVISGLGIMIITIALLRMNSTSANENGFIATHLRIDGILTGVLFSYLIHFTNLKSFVARYAICFFIMSGLFLLPILLQWPSSNVQLSLALLSMNIGFTGLILLANDPTIYDRILKFQIIKIPMKSVALIGLYSYNIYLWHSLVKFSLNQTSFDARLNVVLYFILAIGVGAGVSLLFEQPLLRWRNRVFK